MTSSIQKKTVTLIALQLAQTFSNHGMVSAASSETECYSSWTSLKNDIEFGNNGGGTYNICPGAILNAAESPTKSNKWQWIYLTNDNSRNGITIQCGDNGKLNDNCMVQGGKHQFTMAGSPGKITIKGIIFAKSKMSCIHALGISNPVNIVDCLFTKNADTGKTNENAGTVNFDSSSKYVTFTRCKFISNSHTSDDGKLINVEQSSSVTFDGCIIQNNFGKNKHLVHANGGDVTFNKCKFVDNETPGYTMLYADSDYLGYWDGGGTITLNECIIYGNKAWSIIAAGNLSDIEVYKSCFANNIVTGRGVAVVGDLGGGKTGNDNYGAWNSKCNGFYKDHSIECQKFGSNQCQSSLKNELPVVQPATASNTHAPETSSSSTTLSMGGIIAIVVGRGYSYFSNNSWSCDRVDFLQV